MKYILLVVLILIIILVLITISILLIMQYYGKKYIIDNTMIYLKLDTVIILGAGIRVDGEPCDLLADRIKTGVEIFLKGNIRSILLTGEEKDETYNEVLVMKRWIKKNYKEMNYNVILLDGLGLCTYDSMIRARYIFDIKKAIISTNKYHLARSIYIARKFGIEAYGIPSDLRQYDRMKKYKKREILAQIKDFILVNLFRIKVILKNREEEL